eukprot:TRINITY_DN72984_c0_g1_i1.p1 TRINITY_DN72984_c0_g1~~TRINITY_DN72984_c0_g1_i1.p1  ORF type:complete len:265 (-),score=24.02 TRINITY_DN72984_c0_g1_i1:217-1011(-)
MATLFRTIGDLALRNADTDYPLEVHIPHSLISIANYRQWREREGLQSRWLYDLVVSILTHSQGGGIGCKAAIEGHLPVHYLVSRWDYAHVHFFSYLAAYWSPGDVIFRNLSQPRNPLRLLCLSMDSLDAISTLAGVLDAVRRRYPANKLAPVMVGVILFQSGSFWRLLDERSRGKSTESFLTAPGSGVSRGIAMALLYWYVGHGFAGGRHRNRALLALTTCYILLDMLQDICGFDAFAKVHKPALASLSALRDICHLGPSKASR